MIDFIEDGEVGVMHEDDQGGIIPLINEDEVYLERRLKLAEERINDLLNKVSMLESVKGSCPPPTPPPHLQTSHMIQENSEGKSNGIAEMLHLMESFSKAGFEISDGIRRIELVISNLSIVLLEGVKENVMVKNESVKLPEDYKSKANDNKGKKRQTILPDDFDLTAHRKEVAETYWKKKGREDLDVEEQFERFRDHFMANGDRRASWDHTWRTWYFRAVEFNKKPYQPYQPAGGDGFSEPDAGEY